MNTAIQSLFKEANIPLSAIDDRRSYINTVRNGISGTAIKAGSKLIDRGLFIKLLDTSSANLSRFYDKKNLSRSSSEEVLDTFCVIAEVIRIWDDEATALLWLNTPIAALAGDKPIDLFDTFNGRQWVLEVMTKIEYGEFN